MDSVFLQAAWIWRPQVLGVQLRPYSLGHQYALRALESPYLCAGAPTIIDTALAVWVCSRAWCDLRSMPFESIDAARQWSQTAYRRFKRAGHPMDTEMATFAAYFDHYTGNLPQHWQGSEHKPRVRCPIEWHLVVTLLQSGLCERDLAAAWDMPVSTAAALATVIGERNGSESYFDERDRADIQELNRREEIEKVAQRMESGNG